MDTFIKFYAGIFFIGVSTGILISFIINRRRHNNLVKGVNKRLETIMNRVDGFADKISEVNGKNLQLTNFVETLKKSRDFKQQRINKLEDQARKDGETILHLVNELMLEKAKVKQ